MLRLSLRTILIAVALLVVVSGVAFAVTRITREVGASVNITIKTPDGIEVYLDADLTLVADTIEFGTLEVDLFGAVRNQTPVPVWVENLSFSTIRLTLDDDYASADVVILGDPEPEIPTNSVLPVELAMRFHQRAEGSFSFTVFFNADGPLDLPPPTPTATPTPTRTPAPPTVTPTPPAPPTPTPTPSPTITPTATPTTTPTPTVTPTSQTVDSDIVNFALEDLTISVGTEVIWTNRDSSAHRLASGVSPNASGDWNSSVLSTNDTFSFTFVEVGVQPYFCTLHPFMTGTVTINDN